jgi:hypothetical protein
VGKRAVLDSECSLVSSRTVPAFSFGFLDVRIISIEAEVTIVIAEKTGIKNKARKEKKPTKENTERKKAHTG